MRRVHWLLVAILAWTGLFWYSYALGAREVLSISLPQPIILVGALGMVLLTGWFAHADGGWPAVRIWLARSLSARHSVKWYFGALMPAAVLVLCAIALPVSGISVSYNASIGVALVGLIIPAWIEETVWRGYALPHLLDLHSPFVASLVLVLVWLLWHIPFYLMPGYNAWGIGGWLAWAPFYVVFTCFLTWLAIHTRCSVWITTLSHFAVNAVAAYVSPAEIENYLAMGGATLLLPVIWFLWRFKGRQKTGQLNST